MTRLLRYAAELTQPTRAPRMRWLIVLSVFLLLTILLLGNIIIRHYRVLDDSVQHSSDLAGASARTLSQLQRENLRLQVLLMDERPESVVLELQHALLGQRMMQASRASLIDMPGAEQLMADTTDLLADWETRLNPLIVQIIEAPSGTDRAELRQQALEMLRGQELEINALITQAEINRLKIAADIGGKSENAVGNMSRALAALAMTGLGLVVFVGLVWFSFYRWNQLRTEALERLSTLGEEARKLSQVAARTKNMVVIADAQGRVEWVNEAFEKLTGYTLAEIQGKTPGSLLQGPASDPTVVQFMRERIRRGEGFEVEIENYTKSGEKYWVSIEVKPGTDAQGKLLNFIAIETDITGQKAFEAERMAYLMDLESVNLELVEHQERLRSLYEIATQIRTLDDQLLAVVERGIKGLKMRAGIIARIQDHEYTIVQSFGLSGSFNRGFTYPDHNNICGLALASDSKLVIIADLKKLPTPVAHPWIRSFAPRAYVGAAIYVGGELYGSLSFVSDEPLEERFNDADREFISLIVQWVSTTLDRQMARDELTENLAELERSNRELEDFAYIASHDLQEPLRKIQSFGSRLAQLYGDRLDERGQDYIRRMESAAERMQGLIEGLLSFSRVTTQARPFGRTDLSAIVHEVLVDLEVRIEQTRAQVEVVNLPVVHADSTQMRQLFQNLIGNALKFYDPQRPLKIRVDSELAAAADGETQSLYLRVTDTGIGFDEKHADRIFGMFQRLHGRGEYEGTGVGLAICRKIVERHGGTITASSQGSAFGSAFIVAFPASMLAQLNQTEAAP